MRRISLQGRRNTFRISFGSHVPKKTNHEILLTFCKNDATPGTKWCGDMRNVKKMKQNAKKIVMLRERIF